MKPNRVVVACVLVFAVVYILLDFNKAEALRYGADTGAFLQWLSGEAHGRGSWNGAEHRPHLQVHDSWILLGLVPLVAAFPFVQTLLVVQVLAVAAAAIPLYAFARACGADERGATIVSVAYLLSPSTQGLAYGNFVENIFVPLFAACTALAIARRSLWSSLLCGQLLLVLKEDQALFIAWFGASCTLWWDRRIGSLVTLLAVINGLGFILAERLHGAHPSIPTYGLHVDQGRSRTSPSSHSSSARTHSHRWRSVGAFS